DNSYQAQSGIQNVLFDFGGSSTDANGMYKMNGSILQGDKTKDSSYTLSNLGSIDINNIDVSTEGSTGEKDFYDVLNKTINATNYDQKDSKGNSLSALQLQNGTLGLIQTSISGDINWNKIKDSSSTEESPVYDRNITLDATFNDTYHLSGSLKGDGKKDIVFTGDKSFNKDITPTQVGVSAAATTIQGGDSDSSYSFDDVGIINQNTFDNLLNGGYETTDGNTQGKASNVGTFNFNGSTAIIANITDAKDNANITSQTINLGTGDNSTGVIIRGDISTTAKVNAKFGVGSVVDINNKNKDSIYDFSAFDASSAPIIANINLDTKDNSSDGIKKASIKGLDNGRVSLIGTINDSNQTFNTEATDTDASSAATIKTTNNYKFGDWSNDKTRADSKSSWLVTGDSSVASLLFYNHSPAEQAAALASSTFSNAGSIIDLRGARILAQDTAFTAAKMIAGASDLSSTSEFTPTTLEVQSANLDNAIFRLGVDTTTKTADYLKIDSLALDSTDTSKSIGYRTSNVLQVYLEQGSTDIKAPILLATVTDPTSTDASKPNIQAQFFKAVGYSEGLYNINPIVSAKYGNPTQMPNPDEDAKASEDAPAPSDTSSTTSSDTSTTALSSAIIAASDTSTPSSSSSTDTASSDGASSASMVDPSSMSWYLTGFNVAANTSSVQTISGTLGTFYRDFRIATNNLNLRMGELRNNSASQGVWARIINGLGSDNSNNQDFYTTLQAGYDYQFDVAGGVNYLGVDAEASMISSKGDAYSSTGRNLGIGIYNTYIMDNGFYVDASFKYLNLGNRISIKNSALLSDSTSSLTSNAFLLGAEVGYRYSLDTLMKKMKAPSNAYTQGYYIEPQLEMIYGYIGGNSYDLMMNNASINASLAGNNALISRVGAVLGKHFKYDNGMLLDLRVGLSYINELNTGGEVSLSQQVGVASSFAPIDVASLANNKLNLSLGANMKLSDDWRLYADVSRTFLGVYNIDYNLNVGARFSFGKKVSDLEKQITEGKNK
ncbi:autotransporter outer membrane beta-barrel domain-containing protein, partial [Helicobacter cappadocius]